MYPRFVDVLRMRLTGFPGKLLYIEMRLWEVGGKTVDACVGATQHGMAKWAEMC